ncbi:hypothetical protein NCCP1664_17490 [Zafaria cholistanensis]|uniref:Uncharacterized protein n=1 Tax=Zafaria cholistanensis TaxID=1682741 RepID=A0A5A7NQX1_9MICC|nr:hypothetical protein NCCP1664_17490 [Zafaria cholistanensis]
MAPSEPGALKETGQPRPAPKGFRGPILLKASPERVSGVKTGSCSSRWGWQAPACGEALGGLREIYRPNLVNGLMQPLVTNLPRQGS